MKEQEEDDDGRAVHMNRPTRLEPREALLLRVVHTLLSLSLQISAYGVKINQIHQEG